MKVPGESFVPNKINGLEPRPARVAPASGIRAPAGATGAGSEQAAGGADGKLTQAARNLAAIEESLRALPAADDLAARACKQALHADAEPTHPQRTATRRP